MTAMQCPRCETPQDNAALCLECLDAVLELHVPDEILRLVIEDADAREAGW